MQSFRFVEKRWCLHVDIVTPGDAFLPQNNMLTRQRVLNVSSAVSSGQTPRNQSSFAVTDSPRDYVLPYEQFRFRMQDVSAMSGNRIIHVLSHSHWDREWYPYLSLEQFRRSLIIDLDRVFEMLSDSSYNFHHYHMDGKFLIVEDYLEVKPQMRQTTVAELAECTAKFHWDNFIRNQPSFYLPVKL